MQNVETAMDVDRSYEHYQALTAIVPWVFLGIIIYFIALAIFSCLITCDAYNEKHAIDYSIRMNKFLLIEFEEVEGEFSVFGEKMNKVLFYYLFLVVITIIGSILCYSGTRSLQMKCMVVTVDGTVSLYT